MTPAAKSAAFARDLEQTRRYLHKARAAQSHRAQTGAGTSIDTWVAELLDKPRNKRATSLYELLLRLNLDMVKSDGGELSDFATGPSPFPDTPWQEAQDRRNSFRPGFSSGCACRTSIVPIIAEAANKATHVVRISLHPLRVCPFNSRSRTARAMMSPLHALGPPWLGMAVS